MLGKDMAGLRAGYIFVLVVLFLGSVTVLGVVHAMCVVLFAFGFPVLRKLALDYWTRQGQERPIPLPSAATTGTSLRKAVTYQAPTKHVAQAKTPGPGLAIPTPEIMTIFGFAFDSFPVGYQALTTENQIVIWLSQEDKQGQLVVPILCFEQSGPPTTTTQEQDSLLHLSLPFQGRNNETATLDIHMLAAQGLLVKGVFCWAEGDAVNTLDIRKGWVKPHTCLGSLRITAGPQKVPVQLFAASSWDQFLQVELVKELHLDGAHVFNLKPVACKQLLSTVLAQKCFKHRGFWFSAAAVRCDMSEQSLYRGANFISVLFAAPTQQIALIGTSKSLKANILDELTRRLILGKCDTSPQSPLLVSAGRVFAFSGKANKELLYRDVCGDKNSLYLKLKDQMPLFDPSAALQPELRRVLKN